PGFRSPRPRGGGHPLCAIGLVAVVVGVLSAACGGGSGAAPTAVARGDAAGDAGVIDTAPISPDTNVETEPPAPTLDAGPGEPDAPAPMTDTDAGVSDVDAGRDIAVPHDDAASPSDAGLSSDTGAGANDAGGPIDVAVAPEVGGSADTGADTAAPPWVPRPDPETLPIFDETRVVDFHVSFPPGEWERLLSLRGEAPTRWVRCSIRFETTTFPEASCRRKGNMFDWDRTDAKPQFVVRFNGTDPNGRFFGLRRLNFEHFSGWAAPVRDRLGMWLMRQAGVVAPRVNHARVYRDGRLLGVYQNVETIDRELLEDHFGRAAADGNLWESGVELETNEESADRSARTALDQLIEQEPLQGDHTAFWARLASMMDIKQVLREMAGETALIAKDNFSNNLRNYYFYEHPTRGFLVLPWDFDDILIPMLVDADPFEFWAHSTPSKLRLLINQNPAWKAEYVEHLIDIRDNVLAKMPAYLDMVCAQIRPAVAEDMNTFYRIDHFDSGCADLRALIPARVAALKRMLGR
ncbi:MAG TPA: CotH kinase family protein, partial [Polyangia bacterium]